MAQENKFNVILEKDPNKEVFYELFHSYQESSIEVVNGSECSWGDAILCLVLVP